MPRRKRYKGLIEFTIRDGFMSPGRRGNATITLHATEGPYEGWLQELVETSHVTRVPGYRGIRSNYTLNSS